MSSKSKLHTFRKHERLKSRKLIEALFEKGQSADVPPLKLTWMTISADSVPPQASQALAGFSVSKRTFPRAVDRNRIKRLMREAWRMQKNELYGFLAAKNIRLAVMLIFTGKQKPEFKEVSERLAVLVQRLKNRTNDVITET